MDDGRRMDLLRSGRARADEANDSMRSDSWIARSGQAWKIHVFWVAMSVTALVNALFIASVNGLEIIPGVGQGMFAMAMMGSGVCSGAWIIRAIRCRHCGHRPVWPILNRAPAAFWYVELMAMRECPACRRDR